MLTQDDIKKLKVIFPTKEEFKKFATKLEISKLEVDMKLGFDQIREEMATNSKTPGY